MDQNASLSKLYEEITLGKKTDPGPLIRERFGARWVFSDIEHDAFYDNAIHSGWFDLVYEDSDCVILRLRDVKGAPPPEANPSGNNDADNADKENTP